jgi:hypothetical protein
MQNGSYNPKNRLLAEMVYKMCEMSKSTSFSKANANTDLLFLTNANYIHCPSGGKIFLSIIYSI